MIDSKPVETIAGRDEAVALLQAIADPIRWQILAELGSACECVCVLQERIDVAPNLLSYHLKVLREAGLIVGTRRGRWIDYALTPDAVERMRAALPASAIGCPA